MPITIKGIRLGETTLKRQDDGSTIIETSYSLISSADKVLANQSVGGYHGIKVEPSATTVRAMEQFLTLYKADIQIMLGIESE